MSEDIRYKMQHVGDIFVDTLLCVSDTAKKEAKNVVLTLDIWALEKKKTQCLSLIGNRIVLAKKAGLADMTRDDKLTELIAEAEKVDKQIASLQEQKKSSV